MKDKSIEKKLFTGTIPVAKPWFSELEEQILLETLRSGWVAQGPRVKAFEQAVADYVAVPYAIATNSCTSALQLGLEILGVGAGHEVIVPSFTFVATANAVVHRGATPVFIDIDPKTYNIDPKAITAAITQKTKVIMPVDQIGMPADLDSIQAIAQKKNLKILEDAACALGSEYKGKKIGGQSDISCFSFHPRKVITSGEGGMLTTSNASYAEALRIKVSHGASVSDLKRHQSNQIVIEEYPVFGYNFRMSDLQAAVGLGQLKRLEGILSQKRFFAERYNKILSEMPEVLPPSEPQGYKANYQSYMVRILPSAKKDRDEIMKELLAKGISTRRGIMAIHLEPAYRERFGEIHLPETERALRETMILPLYPQMTIEEHDYVIESLKECLAF